MAGISPELFERFPEGFLENLCRKVIKEEQIDILGTKLRIFVCPYLPRDWVCYEGKLGKRHIIKNIGP